MGDDAGGHEGGQDQPVEGVAQGGDPRGRPLRGVEQPHVCVVERELGLVNLAAPHLDDTCLCINCLTMMR